MIDESLKDCVSQADASVWVGAFPLVSVVAALGCVRRALRLGAVVCASSPWVPRFSYGRSSWPSGCDLSGCASAVLDDSAFFIRPGLVYLLGRLVVVGVWLAPCRSGRLWYMHL